MFDMHVKMKVFHNIIATPYYKRYASRSCSVTLAENYVIALTPGLPLEGLSYLIENSLRLQEDNCRMIDLTLCSPVRTLNVCA